MIRFLLEEAGGVGGRRGADGAPALPEEIALGDEVGADLTVLDWLRLHRRRVGTKEGCGSGDCGACTVVIASPGEEGTLRHEAINACIAFVGSLHGKCLSTVESLGRGDELHPVQRAMLEEHGSQCGFCTPGFVMSLYALYRAEDAPRVCREGGRAAADAAPRTDAVPREAAVPATAARGAPTPVLAYRSAANADSARPAPRAAGEAPERAEPAAGARPMTSPAGWLEGLRADDAEALSHRIDRTLGGNLCRCTGYRAIKRAAAVALAAREPGEAPPDDGSVERERERTIAARLREIAAEAPRHPGFHAPRTIAELAELRLRHPDAPLLGGGTDLALEVTQKLAALPRIIHTRSVAELLEVEDHGDALSVGAALSLTRCVELLGERVPGAAELLLRFGSDQVRNQGTIGGNIGSASPIGDLPPLLLALGATLSLQRGEAVREVPIERYFTGYRETVLAAGEFLRSIRIPLPGPEDVFAVHKVSKRMEDDISSVCGAFLIRLDGEPSRAEAQSMPRDPSSSASANAGQPAPVRPPLMLSARIAFGGMAATPKRAPAVEAALAGGPFSRRTIERAAAAFAEDFTPMSDARASAGYRLQIARNLLLRVFLETASPANELRLTHGHRRGQR